MKNTLFNHDQLPAFEGMGTFKGKNFSQYQSTTARCLGITSPDDTIQLPELIKPSWDWILEHYRRIGLEHTKNVIWDPRFEIACEFPDHELSVFMFGDVVNKVRPDHKWFEITRSMNSKNEFISLCQRMNIPVPETLLSNQLNVIEKIKYPVYLKESTSISGVGVFLCNTVDEARDAVRKLNGGAFQLQEPLNGQTKWLNMTYRVMGEKVKRFTSTIQVLSGSSHSGNIFPTGLSDPWETTDVLAGYLHENGMKGYFGFDLALTDDGPLYIECNPRFNGSCYPAIIAEKLGINEWKATKFKTRTNSFDCVNLGDLEFNPKTKTGVIVFNWGPITDKKGIGVMLVGDVSVQTELEERLKEIL